MDPIDRPMLLRDNLSMLLLATISCTFAFAFLSWHLIEKRFLFLKRYLSPRSAAISATMHSANLAVPNDDRPAMVSERA